MPGKKEKREATFKVPEDLELNEKSKPGVVVGEEIPVLTGEPENNSAVESQFVSRRRDQKISSQHTSPSQSTDDTTINFKKNSGTHNADQKKTFRKKQQSKLKIKNSASKLPSTKKKDAPPAGQIDTNSIQDISESLKSEKPLTGARANKKQNKSGYPDTEDPGDEDTQIDHTDEHSEFSDAIEDDSEISNAIDDTSFPEKDKEDSLKILPSKGTTAQKKKDYMSTAQILEGIAKNTAVKPETFVQTPQKPQLKLIMLITVLFCLGMSGGALFFSLNKEQSSGPIFGPEHEDKILNNNNEILSIKRKLISLEKELNEIKFKNSRKKPVVKRIARKPIFRKSRKTIKRSTRAPAISRTSRKTLKRKPYRRRSKIIKRKSTSKGLRKSIHRTR